MPVRWGSTMTGERFLQANRKNRVEKARLDLQLKIYEREKMRNWGLAEKEKKILLSNIESVKRTSGTSNMGVPSEGMRENYYEKSMHSRSTIRLSEKRLMEWKICERQLQRFLKEKAVPVDDILLGDSRPLSTRSAWDDSKTSVSAKEKHGGKVEKERREVQKRVSAFLHGGMHVVDAEGKSKETRTKGDKRTGNNDPSRKNTEKDMDHSRQRHHSDVVRPHTASDQTDSAVKTTKRRPASAVVENKSQKSKFLITKGDVFMDCGFRFTKISGTGPDTPRAQVNNYMQEASRSSSPVYSESDSDQDVFIDERLYGSTRTDKVVTPDNEDTRSETKSILSDKSSKKITKHVSIASFLDQLSEEELEQDLRNVPQSTSRNNSAHLNNNQSPSRYNSPVANSDKSTYSPQISTKYTNSRSHSDVSFAKYNSAHSRTDQPRPRTASARPYRNQTNTFTSVRPNSAMSSRSRLQHSPESAYSRHRDNTQTPTVVELEDEDEDEGEGVAQDHTGTNTLRQRNFENPNMHDAYTVGQAVKSAMVFSKSARKRALENLVNQNSPDKREIIRLERLRKMKSRSAMLSTITSKFNII